jgi:hypothetical protein
MTVFTLKMRLTLLAAGLLSLVAGGISTSPG